MSAALPSSVSA